jgi:CubicO group peptidase (beta-lactamase class C family)
VEPAAPAPQIAAIMTTPRRRPLLAALAPLALASLALAACGDGPAAPVGSTVLRFAECRAPEAYWPTGGWRENCPTAMGVDSAKLRAAFVRAERELGNTLALLVVKGGYVVGEQYHHGVRENTRFDVRSMTKSVVATIAGAAMQQGELASLDARLQPLFPQYFRAQDDPRKQLITLGHVLSMSAGFDPDGQPAQPGTAVSYALTRPMRNDPGTVFFYDEYAFHTGAVALSLTLERDLLDYANQHLFGPMGFTLPSSAWATDAGGFTTGASGLTIGARELAKLGLLHARGGQWEGRRLLPAAWVDSVSAIHVRPAGATELQGYGYGWWVTSLRGYHAFYASGYGGQTLIVIPELDLVTVVTTDPRADQSRVRDYLQLVPDYVLPAVLPKAEN